MTVSDYLEQLQQDRNDLVDNLEAKGITGLSGDETFTELVPQVLNILSGDIDWSTIGYSSSPKSIIEDYNYALEIKNNWDPAVTSLQGKFQDNLNLVYMPKVNISNVTTMQAMFWGCNNLAEIEFSIDNPINLTSLRSTFGYCRRLSEANLSNFEATNVTTFSQMFRDCSKLKKVNLSKMNPTTINDTSSMFNGCVSLEFLDIRNFEFSRSSNITSMFGQSNTTYIPLNCLIIVKDATQKTWFNNTFPSLTNVMTAEEYEESLE